MRVKAEGHTLEIRDDGRGEWKRYSADVGGILVPACAAYIVRGECRVIYITSIMIEHGREYEVQHEDR